MARGWLEKFIGASALLLGVALPSVARAEEKARLVYVRGVGADDCPAEVDLRLWVMARLGYDPFSPQASRVVIARVESREHELHGSVEVADQQGLSTGRRELSSKSERCQELARAMALSISLAIDPERASQPRPTPLETRPEPAAPPREATKPPPSPPASLPPPGPHLFVNAAFAGSLGQLPGLGLGGALSAGLRFRVASLALEAHASKGLNRELEPRGNLSGSLFVAGLSGCVHLASLGVCAVGYAGLQRLGTLDVASPHTSSGLYVGFGPRLSWELLLTRPVAFTVGLEGLLNATRNTALLSGREIWKTAIVGATLSVGASAHFL